METKQDSKNILYSLSLGSSHTSLVAAHCIDRANKFQNELFSKDSINWQKINILGATRLPNNGAIKKGIASSIENLSHSIIEAVDEVERQTGLNIDKVITCLPCLHAQFENHTENYNTKHSEIRISDIDKINTSVLNQKAPLNTDYIHTIPATYSLDGNTDIKNPVGMMGSEISLNFHRIYAPQADLFNIARACYQSGLEVERFVYEPLAAAEGALTEDEKEFGTISISIGNYMTHVCVYLNHFPIYSKEFNIGSHYITKDLAIGLRTTQIEAERIKKEYGRSYTNFGSDILERIEIHGIDRSEIKSVTRMEIVQIIEPRINEILETIHIELKRLKLVQKATKGIVLSGGGALLNGISISAEKIFKHHARIAYPMFISGAIEGLKSPLWTSQMGSFSDLFCQLNNNQFKYKFSSQSLFSQYITKFWQQVKEPFC